MFPSISDFDCLPCREGCEECVDDSPCLLEPSLPLRLAAGAFTAACTLVLVGLAVFTWLKRENKVTVKCDREVGGVGVPSGRFCLCRTNIF